MEQGSQNKNAFHLAGVVPVAGQPLGFNFPWHDCLQPIAEDYLAVERAVLECAYAGCETIWVVCHNEMQPLIKHRLGDYVQDPVWAYRSLSPIPTDEQKLIPIFYVPVHPKDRDKRDCLAWSVLYGANSAHWTCRTLSKWVIPDRFYAAFPYGVYPPEIVKEHRRHISSEKGFFLSSENLTVKDNEYLGFTFDAEDFILCRKKLREEATGIKIPGKKELTNEKLPIEKRWSARFFSLDKVFEYVKMGEVLMVETSWYYNIDNWDKLCLYLGSEERKLISKPSERFINRRFTVHGITLEQND